MGFDALTLDQAAEAAGNLLGRGGVIVTANPEILLLCRRNEEYAQAVNSADLVLADGVGDLLAGRILGTPLPERVAGADLVPRLLKRLADRGGSVFLYGGRPGVAERAAEHLCLMYSGLRIAGTENGYIPEDGSLRLHLRRLRPDLILVGLGAPRQEFWMNANRDLGCVMIGVGGLLDVYSGDVSRSPVAWQRAGLEWLYRLLREPRRITRVAKLPLVPLLAVRERFRRK